MFFSLSYVQCKLKVSGHIIALTAAADLALNRGHGRLPSFTRFLSSPLYNFIDQQISLSQDMLNTLSLLWSLGSRSTSVLKYDVRKRGPTGALMVHICF